MVNNTHDSKSPGLDLNLLTVLNAVIETGSATLAAERLGLSSSSISYALNKLREHFADPIVIRTGTGVKPTLLAINLYNNTKRQIDELAATLTTLDLSENHSQQALIRTLRIRTNSVFDFWLSHILLNDANFHEKYVLEFYSRPGESEPRLELLRNKQIDLDIGFSLGNDRAIIKIPLPPIQLAVVFRKDHPRIKSEADFNQLAKEKIVGWNSNYSMNAMKSPLVSWFREDKMHRIYMSDSLTNAILHTAHSDAITFIPAFMAPVFCKLLSLQCIYYDAIDNEKYNLFCHIHRGNKDDAVLQDIINIVTGKKTQSSSA